MLNHEVSRLIASPDGIARIITLERPHWEAMDRLHERHIGLGTNRQQGYLDHVHTRTSDPVQLESQIRLWFKLVIQDAMADVATVGGKAANEPFPPPPRPSIYGRSLLGRQLRHHLGFSFNHGIDILCDRDQCISSR